MGGFGCFVVAITPPMPSAMPGSMAKSRRQERKKGPPSPDLGELKQLAKSLVIRLASTRTSGLATTRSASGPCIR